MIWRYDGNDHDIIYTTATTTTTSTTTTTTTTMDKTFCYWGVGTEDNYDDDDYYRYIILFLLLVLSFYSIIMIISIISIMATMRMKCIAIMNMKLTKWVIIFAHQTQGKTIGHITMS